MSIDWPDWTSGNVNVVQAAGANTAADITTTTVDVTTGGGVETVMVTSDVLTVQTDPALAVVLGWAQFSDSASSVTYTPRVRRGTLITDPLVGEANAQNTGVALNLVIDAQLIETEFLAGLATVQYVFTLQPAGANTITMIQAGILVMLF